MKKSFTGFKHFTGFTLAELLIALAILGVIATFTIPKILQAQQSQRYSSEAKEAIATMSTAFQTQLRAGSISAANKASDLTPFMNYVNVDTSSVFAAGTMPCSSPEPCLRLHNGAVIMPRWPTFGGTATTNAISFLFEPDASINPTPPAWIFVYYNGRITSYQNVLPGTTDSSGIETPQVDPYWFSWN